MERQKQCKKQERKKEKKPMLKGGQQDENKIRILKKSVKVQGGFLDWTLDSSRTPVDTLLLSFDTCPWALGM